MVPLTKRALDYDNDGLFRNGKHIVLVPGGCQSIHGATIRTDSSWGSTATGYTAWNVDDAIQKSRWGDIAGPNGFLTYTGELVSSS